MKTCIIALCGVLLATSACAAVHDDSAAADLITAHVQAPPAQPAAAGAFGIADAGVGARAPTSPSSPAADGGGGCPALTPAGGVTADTSAFTGVGGAGFDVVGVCDRCGWSHTSDACRNLVYTVPTVSDSDYQSCWTQTFRFSTCVTSESCICDHRIPEPCIAAQAELAACRRAATDAGERNSD